jgi:hypothetical protein
VNQKESIAVETKTETGDPGATALTGDELTHAYLRRLADRRVPAEELTATVRASEPLAVVFRGRFLPRPVFLGAAELTDLMADLRTVHAMLGALPQRLFGGSHTQFVREVGILPVQQAVTARAFYGALPMLARFDLYRSAEGFRILESNHTSALGGFSNADINRAMLGHPVLSEFVADHHLEYADTLRGLVDTMLAECGALVRGDRPVVALVDWPASFVGGYERRLRMMAALLATMGVDAVPCHVGQLRERDGRLEADGRAIDIIYRFFVVKEIATQEDADLLEPILRTMEAGGVGMFTPIGADVYGSKDAMAMLWDERNLAQISGTERACLERVVPWSSPLRRAGRGPDGEEVDLVDFAVANQHELILKPSLDYGGNGIVAGWTVTPDEWGARLEAGARGGHIIQLRVRPMAEPFPSHGQTGSEGMYLNWGIFLVDAEATGSDGYGGALLRGTSDPDTSVVNLGSGALPGCCFHSARESS